MWRNWFRAAAPVGLIGVMLAGLMGSIAPNSVYGDVASGAVAPRQGGVALVSIERPERDLLVAGSVLIEGWAADPSSPEGAGIEGIDLYLDQPPDTGGTPIATLPYGIDRPEVAARLGDARFTAVGFQYRWDLTGVAPGQHLLHAVARKLSGGAVGASVPIRVSDKACLPKLIVDNLAANQTLAGPLRVTGYAADPGSQRGSGITNVTLYLDQTPDQGATPVATAIYGISRPEAIIAYGEPRFGDSGFSLEWDPATVADGPHTLYVVASGACQDVVSAFPVTIATQPSTQAPASQATPAPVVVVQPVTPSTLPLSEAGGCVTINVSVPQPNNVVSPPFVISGTAYDLKSTADTGVYRVAIYAGAKDSGGRQLGPDARYGLYSKATAESVGPRFANSVFSATLSSQMGNGPLVLYVYATGSCGEGWRSIPLWVDNSLAPGTVQPGAAPAAAQNAAPGSAPTGANPPQPPPNAQVATSGSAVTLSWGASPSGNVNNYTIWQSTDGSTFTQVQTKPAAETSHTFSNLNPSTIYYFFVVARNQAGDTSARSNVAGPVVLGGGEIVPPSNLQVSWNASTGSATLTWNKSPSPGVANYFVFLGRNQTTPVLYFQTTNADTTTANLPLQNAGAQFLFYVTAVVGNQQSSPSNIVGPCNVGTACNSMPIAGSGGAGATTGSAPPSNVFGGLPGGSSGSVATPVSVTPQAPTNLTAQAVDQTTILLSWTAPTAGAPTNYQIYQATNGGSFVSLGLVTGATVNAQIPKLTSGSTYSFYIVPLNGGAPGPQSNTTSPLVLSATSGGVAVGPTNLVVTFPANSTSATVSWQPVIGNAVIASYRLSWSGPTSGQMIVPVNQSSVIVTGLAMNQTYSFTLQGIDNNNQLAGTAANAIGTPNTATGGPLAAPQQLSGTPSAGRIVTLNWLTVPGATSYRIYRNGSFVGSRLAPSTTYQEQVSSGGVGAHTYYVTAVNAANQESQQSNVITINLLP